MNFFQQRASRPVEALLVIADATVIDGVNGVREAQTIVVRDGEISQIGAAASVRAPAGARIIDARNRYIIPGLWDAHVHLTYISSLGLDTWYPLLIANGVTSVRDMGGPLHKVLEARKAARDEDIAAPRVYIAGPLIDGPKPLFPSQAAAISNTAQVRAEINSLRASGVDFIKLYELLAPEVFADAVRHAHECGMPVGAHVPLAMDVIDAAETGVDSLEHVRTFEMACAANWPELLSERRAALAAGPKFPGDPLRSFSTNTGDSIHALQRIQAIQTQDEARVEKVIAALKANEVMQTPTLANITEAAKRPYTDDKWRETFDYIPASLREVWLEATTQVCERAVTPDVRDFTNWAMAMVTKLNNCGVKLMAGTDAPSHFLAPGFSLHQELLLLVECGLTPMQALTAATLRPAEFMGLEAQLGAIDAGKWADMVLLDANPLDDIRNTESISAVIKAGQVYDRAALDGMLAELKTRNAQ